MHSPKSRLLGVTLVEILIAMIINVILLYALISVFSTTLTHESKTSQDNYLNQQLETVLQIMTNDIRRAGYWGNANSDIGKKQNNNPFMAAGTDVSIVGGTCILFSYDKDNNGTLPAVSNAYDDERYGYRLQGNVVQSRPAGATFSCAAPLANWETLNDASQVQITGLSFTLNASTVPIGATTNAMIVRTIDITISGRLTLNTAITKTLTTRVRINNDKYQP